jgi:hypothetical protein
MSGEERAMKERLLSEASDLDSMLDNIDMERITIIRRLETHNEQFEHAMSHYLKTEGLENVLRTVQQRPSDVECEEFLTVRIMPMQTFSGIPINKIATPAQMGQITDMFATYLEQTQMLLSSIEQNFAAKMDIYSQLVKMILVYSPADQPVTEECALIYLSYPGKKNLSMIKIDTQNGIYELPRETLLPNEIELSRRTIELMTEQAEMEESNFYVAVCSSRMLPKEAFLAKATSTAEGYQKDGRASRSLERLGDIFGWQYSDMDIEGETSGDMELSRGMFLTRGRKRFVLPTDLEEDIEYLRDRQGNVTHIVNYATDKRKNMLN